MSNILLIIISSLFFVGIIKMVKAKIAGRKMPSILQPLYDVIRLFKKGAVYSSTTSWIFKVAPLVYFASVVIALAFVPVGAKRGLLSFEGDFLVFAYVLAMGKFFMIIAAMDTGSSFAGMGANREALYSMLIEPAFFIILAAMSLLSHNASFCGFYSSMSIGSNLAFAIKLAAICVLIYIALIENSRMPIDDPNTHLELTMVHEVMVLDNSGFDLAMIHIATWLKFSIYATLIADFVINTTWLWYYQVMTFFSIQFLLPVVVGVLESFRARNKMAKNPQWIIMLSAIAIVTFLTTLIMTKKVVLN